MIENKVHSPELEEYGEARALKDIPEYDPTTTIAILWGIEDVKSLRPTLTDEQCMEVLQLCKAKHDACIGINWEVIEIWIDHLFGYNDA